MQLSPAVPPATVGCMPSVGIVENFFDRAVNTAAGYEPFAREACTTEGEAGTTGLEEPAADDATMNEQGCWRSRRCRGTSLPRSQSHPRSPSILAILL